jgi:hypothetical protein
MPWTPCRLEALVSLKKCNHAIAEMRMIAGSCGHQVETPVHAACLSGFCKVLEVLKQRGASLSCVNRHVSFREQVVPCLPNTCNATSRWGAGGICSMGCSVRGPVGMHGVRAPLGHFAQHGSCWRTVSSEQLPSVCAWQVMCMLTAASPGVAGCLYGLGSGVQRTLGLSQLRCRPGHES